MILQLVVRLVEDRKIKKKNGGEIDNKHIKLFIYNCFQNFLQNSTVKLTCINKTTDGNRMIYAHLYRSSFEHSMHKTKTISTLNIKTP